MTADVGPLLDLQRADSTVLALQHRLAALPERAAVENLETELKRGRAALAQAQARATEARRGQDQSEAALSTLEAKAATVSDRLYGRAGVVSSPKELQALQADLDMINRQKSQAEETVLVAMEQREDAVDLEKRTEQAVGALEDRQRTAREALARTEGEVEAEMAEAEKQAQALRPQVPAPVLALYDRLRRQMPDGVAAAALHASVCQGCHQRLSNVESEEARRSADVVRCEACRRILVLE